MSVCGMSESEYVVAEISRLHRLASSRYTRVMVAGDAVLMQGTSSETGAKLPISEIDEIVLRRGLLWSDVSLRMTDGESYSVGGLSGADAERVHARVRAEIAHYAETVRGPLSLLAEKVSPLLDDSRYTRHSEGAAAHESLEAALRRYGLATRQSLAAPEAEILRGLDALTPRENFEAALAQANERYISAVLPSVRDAARPVTLTDEQAGAVAADEDTALVLAGAGTGKTSVIVGKAAHLVRNLNVPPEDILVIAYNRKATGEIRERLPEDLRDVEVSTFHAFGRRVIAETEGAPAISRLAGDGYTSLRAFDGIIKRLLSEPGQSRAVLEFIAYHQASYRSAFSFNTPAEYDEHIRQVELRALSGDLVKSFEELMIANYLTEHGVRFRYEAFYPVETADRERRQYQPDFYLPDRDIYIEHFALDESGQPPPGWRGYAEGVEWKRGLHRQRGTSLVESYSWQRGRGTLLTELKEKLEARGVAFERVPVEALVSKLGQQRISWLAGLVATFLSHVKERQAAPRDAA